MSVLVVAPGLRVVAALAAGALPVRRPGGRVHMFLGDRTASGRYGKASGRLLCGTYTVGRLHVLEQRLGVLDLAGGRFCRRCMSLLPACLGRDVHRLSTVDDVTEVYGHLTVGEFRQAAVWTRTVEETHQVARFASNVLGAPKLHGRRTPEEQAVYDLDRLLIGRRDRLRVAELPAETRAANLAAREAEADDRRRTRAERGRAIARERAEERTRRGLYVRPEERALVGSP